jgi:hypothetical protein
VVEVDAVPGGHVCSASLKGTPRTSVRDVAQGDAPLRKLFSKDQRAFFAEHAPEGIGFEDLSLLGPIFVLKLKGVPEGFARKMVVELWLYPDGARHPRALDEVRAVGGLPGGRRGPRVPGPSAASTSTATRRQPRRARPFSSSPSS